MLQENKIELHTTGYENYLSCGGQFPYSIYLFVQKKLNDVKDLPNLFVDGTLPRYMEHIASCCELEATPTEKILYSELSTKRKLENTPSLDEAENNGKCPCCMGDIELAREIFLFTDSSLEKYDAMTERFPNVFSHN